MVGGRLVGVMSIAIALLAEEARADELVRGGKQNATVTSTSRVGREAQRRFERGAKAFEAAEYDVAYDNFEAAYTLSPRPMFMLAMARAQLKMGNDEKARDLLQLCLASGLDDDELRVKLADLDARVGQQNDRAVRPPLLAPLALTPSAAAPLVIGPAAGVTADGQEQSHRRWYRHWWVWMAGAALLAGAGTAIAVSVSRPHYADRGNLGYLGVPDR